MNNQITLSAHNRVELGKADVRRLRRLDSMVPAVVYGGKNEPQPIKLALNDVLRIFQHESSFSQIIDLDIDGQVEPVIVKDALAHPYKPLLMHIDFQRVDRTAKITVKVPLHYTNEEAAVGIKAGGIASKILTEVEVSCLPADLVDHIDIDVSAVEVGQTLHLSDIALPNGVSLATLLDDEHNQAIYNIHTAAAQSSEAQAKKGFAEDAEEAEAADK